MKDHKKAVKETGVKSYPAFCLKSSIKKTNSEGRVMVAKNLED